MLGQLPAGTLATAAGGNNGQVCEAWYYIALREELNGHAEAARTAYQRCQATHRTDFIEYTLATTALKEMEKSDDTISAGLASAERK